ncbi:Nif11-like leader peptide family natural product precursor [Geitlerinema sp. PCC 7407]|uniref:Nif11-like leader peptide family natural product precursor n=1 Tax=Geitlerinema sp. PCC 7407 TaxID=1173025 RepID=UPI00029FC431|nr:Nif11-like leader peptide family natural product precursor [Geitlerinema sp. PCC 7407]AFY64960.1 protein of unknown function nitrogen fixation [Geitlerinema sp. PCC 7407]
MSKERASDFLEAIAQDETLRHRFQGVEDGEAFLAIADEMGYTFSIGELKEVIGELSEGVQTRRHTGVWKWLRSDASWLWSKV